MSDDPVTEPLKASVGQRARARKQEPGLPPHGHIILPCQHAYTELRERMVTRPRSAAAKALFLVFDVPVRWLMDMIDTVIGNRGYFVIGSAIAAYPAIFGLIDSKSTREETRTSLERSLFVTLVSGNATSFSLR
jgi:hypothetical protein